MLQDEYTFTTIMLTYDHYKPLTNDMYFMSKDHFMPHTQNSPTSFSTSLCIHFTFLSPIKYNTFHSVMILVSWIQIIPTLPSKLLH